MVVSVGDRARIRVILNRFFLVFVFSRSFRCSGGFFRVSFLGFWVVFSIFFLGWFLVFFSFSIVMGFEGCLGGLWVLFWGYLFCFGRVSFVYGVTVVSVYLYGLKGSFYRIRFFFLVGVELRRGRGWVELNSIFFVFFCINGI